jgi:surface carbohydrate biosynthesis protein (TIGR04326 family)
MKSIVIWDNDFDIKKSNKLIIHWRSYGSRSDHHFDISDIVEENSKEIREKYLAWVYSLGNKKYQDKTITELLSIQGTFSFWWMSLIVEKSNFSKSPQIDDACKLIAFDKLASSISLCDIIYCGNNNQLAECFEIWSKQRKVKFKYQKSVKSAIDKPFKDRLYQKLPYFFQAVLWLIYYIYNRWSLSGVGIVNWRKSKSKLSFVSYFANLNKADLSENKFGSYYWNDIVSSVANSGVSSNWLHIYIPNSIVNSPKRAKELIELLNNENKELQTHVLLDSFLSLRVIHKVIKDWFKLRNRASKLDKTFCELDNEVVNIWPLFKNDWFSSFQGKTSISNIWHFHLLDEAMKFLPKQEKCVYLQENIDWEYAFLYAWKTAGHGDAIGFPHSSIRFWDLRYFFDKRLFFPGINKLGIPLPNYIAVNGPIAKELLLDAGYPFEMLIDVEAIRYNYLMDIQRLIERKRNNKSECVDEIDIQLLIVGDIEFETNQMMIKILQKVSLEIMKKLVIKFKPHPLCPISTRDLFGLPIEITSLNLSELLCNAEIVFSGALTSAAIEAYLFEVPVITLRLSRKLNLSPLRGMNDGVYFIRDFYEFENAIIESMKLNINQREQDIFYIDPFIPRWKKLLNL